MNNTWKRKLVAGILAASMAFSNIPVTVLAEAESVETVGQEEMPSETWVDEAVPEPVSEVPAEEPAEDFSQQEVFVIEEYPEADIPVDTDSYETGIESEIPQYEDYEEQPAEEQPAEEEIADEEFAEEEFVEEEIADEGFAEEEFAEEELAEEELLEEDPEAIEEWLVESDEEEIEIEDEEDTVLYGSVGNYSVMVTAAPGVIPEGAELRVAPIFEGSSDYNEAL